MKNNNIIRRGLSVLSVSLLMAMVSSCSDRETLDLQPYNNLYEDIAFTSAVNVDLAVMGVYNAAQNGIYKTAPDAANTPRGYVFGAAYVEQNDVRGEDMVNTATFYQLTYTATYDGGSPNNSHYWMNGYGLVNKANITIDGLKKAGETGVITPAVRDNYLGEMYFLRALAHLELLKHFSRPYNFTANASHPGIPYRTTAITSPAAIEEALKVGRGTVAETYAKILADLDQAELLTASKSTRSGNARITRATKEAAIALKVRAYLNMRDWTKVLTEGAKLSSAYTLTATPDVPFILANNYNNSESVFSIENSANTNPGTNAGLASMYRDRSLVCISPIIWRNPRWLLDDKRRAETAMVRTSSAGVKYVNKYKDVTNLSDGSPIMRYAEVILSMAEAYARQGNTASAITYLNMVRNRSLATPATQQYTAASFANATDLVDAIITERRIEFLGEGMRWGDIHRLLYDDLVPTPGIPAKVGNSTPPGSAFTLGTPYTGPLGVAMIPKTDFRILWPIPNDEIVNNPTLAAQQNPQW
ncbi:RagB/SusD family nutrient uptake outer membrane protein [Chryseobacterium joostei]|uniref:RagB/SusD family nutrient uptake outer membrane protein n=1 Tax=Chryseobacterium joostei TaxID=112234 RepID=A0A1N7I2S8_9FLAO|nr:RagB/SusD family nutrient uptake outer membrane protein [Chryseobacterium joostei]AZA99651.1 RagB/SusD family nutrient uptake outer membrane protein [Chryseobacterium joostei]SIS31356.1 Starch-binding associating with outer membrane [Chryseobacterium joostei]